MALGDIIGRPYQGTHSLGNWQSDDAYDISAPVGTPMVSAVDGVVVSVSRHPQDNSRFAGDGITIRTQDGNELFYKHGVASVKAGDQIKAGQQIGTTGSANGSPHLHFAALHNPSQFLDDVFGGGKSLVDKVTGGIKDAATAPFDAVTGAAGDAAGDVAKSAVSAIWKAVGDDGARALLYAVLVFGGVALAIAGLARATGVGQLAKDVNAKGQEAALLVATKGAV